MKVNEKKKQFMACLTEAELELLRREAKETGLSVSDVLRRIIDKHYAQRKSQ